MTDSPMNGISPSIKRGHSNDRQGITCIVLWILSFLIVIGLGAVSLIYIARSISSIVRSAEHERGTATEFANVNATAQERGTATALANLNATATANQILRATSTPAVGDVIFRDNFDEVLAEGWTWHNEDKSAWRITNDGQLEIVAGDATLLSTENGQNNVLLRDCPFGNFDIVARVSARPIVDFQQAAILIYQDDDNFVAINRGYCSPCVGNAVYLDNEVEGDAFSSFGIWFPTDATELYLRLVRRNDIYTALFSLDGETWTEVGHIHRMLWPLKVGLGVTNADQTAEQDGDLIAKFDYFVIREIR
jgi:hypothetical protein